MEKQEEFSIALFKYRAAALEWTSDLEFFKVEIIFFHRLLDDYFIRLSVPEYIQKLRAIENELLELDNDRHELDKRMSDHLNGVEFALTAVTSEKGEELEVTHIRLGYQMTELMHNFRQTKTALFTIVEQVVKDNSLFE